MGDLSKYYQRGHALPSGYGPFDVFYAVPTSRVIFTAKTSLDLFIIQSWTKTGLDLFSLW